MAFGLSGQFEADASSLVSAADEAEQSMDSVSAQADETTESLLNIDAAGVAVGGTLAGIGLGAQKALDDTRPMRESLDRTATSLGITSDEARGLATSMTDVTLSQEDAIATMDLFARQGVDSTEKLERMTLAADNLADATGTSAEDIAGNLAPAVRGLDGDMSALEEDADAFTAVIRNTTLEASDLGSTMERVSPELNEMGVSSSEAATMIGMFGEETGLSGRELRREFSSAVRDADGDVDQLATELGLSQSELEAFQAETIGSSEQTDAFAASVEENATLMDQLRVSVGDAKLEFADYIGPVSAAAPALQGVGTAAIALSTINFSAVIPSLIGVATAAAPVVIPLLAITAAAAGLYLAWDNNIFGIRDIATDAFGTIMDIADNVREAIPGDIGEATDLALDIFKTWHPAGIVWDHRDEIMGAVGDLRDSAVNQVTDLTDSATDIFTTWHPAGIVWDKRDEIMDALPGADMARDAASGFISGFEEGIRDLANKPVDAAEDMAGDLGDRLPGSDAKKGPLSNLTDQWAAIPETGEEQLTAGERDVSRATAGMASGAVPRAGGQSSGGARGSMDIVVEIVGGTLDVDGDVATIRDIDARIERQYDRANRIGGLNG